jgi:peroxiredoxin
MKKLLLTLLAVAPAAAFPQNTFIIKGTAGATNAPAKVFLLYSSGNKSIIDSAVLKNGKFIFTGNINETMIARLAIDYKGTGYRSLFGKVRPDMVSIYLAPGTTVVTSPDSLIRAKATGTKVSEENTELLAMVKPQEEQMKALQAKYQKASPELRKTKEFMDGLNQASREIKEKEKAVSISFIKRHPDSYVSLVLINSLLGPKSDYQDVAPYYDLLSATVKKNSLAKNIATRLDQIKAVSIGSIAPDFTMADTSGKMISSASLKGKYLLINFWAPWSKPSQLENAKLIPLVKAYYKEHKLDALGVCISQPGKSSDWAEAIRKDGVTWPQVSDSKHMQNAAASLYNIHMVPSNVLIDPSGRIIAKNLRSDELADKLSQFLGKI